MFSAARFSSYEKRAQPDARANGPERPWLILNVRCFRSYVAVPIERGFGEIERGRFRGRCGEELFADDRVGRFESADRMQRFGSFIR